MQRPKAVKEINGQGRRRFQLLLRLTGTHSPLPRMPPRAEYLVKTPAKYRLAEIFMGKRRVTSRCACTLDRE